MKKFTILAILSALFFSCGVSKDLARTLRFADTGRTLGIDEISFKELKTMKKGQSCTWNLLFFIPIFGDGSIITSAEKGDINFILENSARFYSFSPTNEEKNHPALVFKLQLNQALIEV